MHLTTSSEVLSRIWEALQEPAPSRVRRADRLWTSVAQKGWVLRVDFEDELLLADRRLSGHDLRPSDFTAMLDLPWRYVYHRPKHRFDEPIAFEGLTAEDAASTLILLERIGFSIDPEPLCSSLRPALRSALYATNSGIFALFHDKSAQRTEPLTIAVKDQAPGERIFSKIKLGTGYRAELASTGTGSPQYLTVYAPRYRPRREPKLTTCPVCGATYVHGLPSDDETHRRIHRDVLAVLEPQPHKRFARVRIADETRASWVDYRSPQWKHELMYSRAVAFKREMKFDFVQWARRPADDPRPIGFLFNVGDRIIGACSFRPPEFNVDRWKMDWVWLCPSARRRGVLGRAWPMFQGRFGDFALEPPLSPAMDAFVAKMGASEPR